jgi:hypothetical protein
MRVAGDSFRPGRAADLRCALRWTLVIDTFASRMGSRRKKDRYESIARYLQYLLLRPHNESDFIDLLDGGDAQDVDDDERIAVDATHVVLRGLEVAVPPREARVLATGELRHYAPTEAPNTHWSNWPLGGTL